MSLPSREGLSIPSMGFFLLSQHSLQNVFNNWIYSQKWSGEAQLSQAMNSLLPQNNYKYKQRLNFGLCKKVLYLFARSRCCTFWKPGLKLKQYLVGKITNGIPIKTCCQMLSCMIYTSNRVSLKTNRFLMDFQSRSWMAVEIGVFCW